MNTEHDRYPVNSSWVRIGLLVLAVPSLGNGLWALFLPRVFYDDFPLPGRDWVSTLGPYNEHLVRDYGATNLALGMPGVRGRCARKKAGTGCTRHLALVYAVPQFVFHLMQRSTISRWATTWRSWAPWGSWSCSRRSCSPFVRWKRSPGRSRGLHIEKEG